MESLAGDNQRDLGELSCDSLVPGINGNAFSFGVGEGRKTFALVESKKPLSSIWAGDFSIILWVSTKSMHKEYEVLASNKIWNNGYVKDYTTNAAFGISRTSGSNKGWAIISQPDGSWAWNIGDGKHRLDYRPTAPRQQINDGMWHQIAFSISRFTNEAYLYFDGINVAIYNIKGFGDLGNENTVSLATDILAESDAPSFQGALDEFKVYDRTLNAQEMAETYSKLVPAAKLPELFVEPVKSLNLMAWNIWHGGRRHGREIGPKQVIDFIKNTGADIVMMQETYGSGALIADALGYYFYLASTNISVISKYPILSTKAPYDAFRLGMTTIELSKGQKINLASLWIHYLPAWQEDVQAHDATPEKIVLGEEATRHREIKEILELVRPEIIGANRIPLIIGGDFNSPSFRDWTEETKEWHNNMIIEWPVSKEMAEAGFKDSFREVRPNLEYKARTMSAKSLTNRIDYIYFKGKQLRAVDSDMHFQFKGAWPSDHPAITTTFAIESE
ncbi:endonuclease/exonuclease/phosphatase family protein [Ulvibacterium sp.]|uniref:endonuclease/exonuclease/phosphatase family protein n=1 Tax=Ulvibacterium sp. TaxID=2665914 RepID=UPI002614C4E2|nr:endonuclease/exonuclease/phosphatase family protein [Ulvibacterium sp.]